MWKRISLVAVLFTSSLTLTAVLLWPVKSLTAPAKSSTAAQQVQLQQGPAAPSQNIRLTIYPEGILPATATAHQGVLSISIEDLANANGGLLIERVDENGPHMIGSVQRFERHWRGRASFELIPGEYRLRIASDKAKAAMLTIEP